MAKVTLKSVWKIFDKDVVAVRDANLEIADKEFMVLVGPSGCGKSTTLRMVAGLEEISRGEITIGDRLVNDVLPKDRDIAMVFQNYALYPHMSVADNMSFSLKLRKFPKAEIRQRVEEAADLLGITELLDRKPKQLSGGQRQRVAIARSLANQPSLVLADEPTGNLDSQSGADVIALLRRLNQELDTTIIVVTHDPAVARQTDRVLVMRDGTIADDHAVGHPFEEDLKEFRNSGLGRAILAGDEAALAWLAARELDGVQKLLIPQRAGAPGSV